MACMQLGHGPGVSGFRAGELRILSSGDRYVGQFEHGAVGPRGTFVSAQSGWSYMGDWVDLKMHGVGQLINALQGVGAFLPCVRPLLCPWLVSLPPTRLIQRFRLTQRTRGPLPTGIGTAKAGD
eukprot:COSAG01_NODE_12949_length_1658_cov_2.021809_3_plen_124_part_00